MTAAEGGVQASASIGGLLLQEMLPSPPYVEEYEIVKGRRAKRLTPEGYRALEVLGSINASQAEVAEAFGVSETWLSETLREEIATGELSPAGRAWAAGKATYKLELRAASKVLDHTNPTVNIHARKVNLGEVPVEKKEVSHTLHVVGMVPKDEANVDSWRKRFGPADAIEEAEIIEEVKT